MTFEMKTIQYYFVDHYRIAIGSYYSQLPLPARDKSNHTHTHKTQMQFANVRYL